MDEDPRFPLNALSLCFGLFCAGAALLTIWLLPIPVPGRVVATAIFALIPFTIVVFWLGRAVEARKWKARNVRRRERLSDEPVEQGTARSSELDELADVNSR